MNCPHCGASFGEGYSQCPVCQRAVTKSGPRTADRSVVVSHSPLPWGLTGQPISVRTSHTEENGYVSEHICSFDHYRAERADELEANAEFIVRAVNSHYQLVEALEQIKRAIAYEEERCPPYTGTPPATRERLIDHLADARLIVRKVTDLVDAALQMAKGVA